MKHSIVLVRFYACNMTTEERNAWELWAIKQPLIRDYVRIMRILDSMSWSPADCGSSLVKDTVKELSEEAYKLQLELWPIIDAWVKENVKPDEYVWDDSPVKTQINHAISQETIDAFNNIMSANEPTADNDFWQLFHCIKSDIEKQQRKVQ